MAFQEAGILRNSEKLTDKAIEASIWIKGGDKLNNPHVISMLTAGGKSMNDWGKYKTDSVTLPTGQSVQIHFYMHQPTGKIANIDYKVSCAVDYTRRENAVENNKQASSHSRNIQHNANNFK